MMLLTDEITKWIPPIKGGPQSRDAHHRWHTQSHTPSRPPPPPTVGCLGLVTHQATQRAASSAGSWVGCPPSSTRGSLLRRLWGWSPTMHCTMHMSESPHAVSCLQEYTECTTHTKSNVKQNTECTITCACDPASPLLPANLKWKWGKPPPPPPQGCSTPPCSGQNFSTVRATVRGGPFWVENPQQGIAW